MINDKNLLEVAERNGFTVEATRNVFEAMRKSGGHMCQFNHPELGGLGQWASGQLMIGDMFNTALRSRVGKLCSELSAIAQAADMNPGDIVVRADIRDSGASGDSPTAQKWWPEKLGVPSTTGSQNRSRYAYFPESNRLAIDQNGKVTIYDTGKHKIHGVSQSQGSISDLLFESQVGPVALSSLPKVFV
ncbi:MAG TPA: hypothetical protein V6C89_09725 [Drouetiella sp.]